MITFRLLNYTNYPAMEKWYEEMAQKGWLLDKLSHLGVRCGVHTFKKSEPENIHFHFVVTRNESKYSKLSSEELEEYHAMAKEKGWTFIGSFHNLDLYSSKEDMPSPFYSDIKLEKQLLKKNVKQDLISTGVLLPLFLVLFFMHIGSLLSYNAMYQHGIYFFVSGFFLFLIFTLFLFVDYATFFHRNKNCFENEKPLIFKSILSTKWISVFFLSAILFVLLGFILHIGDSLMHNSIIMLCISVFPFIHFFIIILFNVWIKPASMSTSSKKQIFGFLLFFAFFITLIFNQYIFNFSLKKHPLLREERFENYCVTQDSISLMIPEHVIYKYDQQDLILEKAVASRKTFARELVKRYVRNAKNHPYFGDLVKEIHPNLRDYDEAYQLLEQEFILRKKNTVLIVYGDLNQPEIIKEVQHFFNEVI